MCRPFLFSWGVAGLPSAAKCAILGLYVEVTLYSGEMSYGYIRRFTELACRDTARRSNIRPARGVLCCRSHHIICDHTCQLGNSMSVVGRGPLCTGCQNSNSAGIPNTELAYCYPHRNCLLRCL